MQLGFGAAILTLLGAGVISYRALVSSNQSQGWVRHTDQVLEELQELLSASENIESSTRGFVAAEFGASRSSAKAPRFILHCPRGIKTNDDD